MTGNQWREASIGEMWPLFLVPVSSSRMLNKLAKNCNNRFRIDVNGDITDAKEASQQQKDEARNAPDPQTHLVM